MPLLQPFDNCRRFQLACWITLQQGRGLLLPNPVEGSSSRLTRPSWRTWPQRNLRRKGSQGGWRLDPSVENTGRPTCAQRIGVVDAMGHVYFDGEVGLGTERPGNFPRQGTLIVVAFRARLRLRKSASQVGTRFQYYRCKKG